MRQVAIVTGASQGIGEAIAMELAKNNFHIVLLARNITRLKEVADKIQSTGGTCNYYQCDISKADEIERTLQAVKREVPGSPSILVNNAGFGGPFHRTDEVSEEEWDLIFATNVKAAFFFCKKILPSMKESNFGRIINISSIYGVVGGAFSSTYAASKHALIGYTKSIAVEWANWNITCNVVSPGYVDTAMASLPIENSGYNNIINSIPCKTQGYPNEIAQLVLFLTKPESGYINGSNFIIDGGLLARFNFNGGI